MGPEREQLSEEDIAALLAELDAPVVVTQTFCVELETSPYVTYSEEALGLLGEALVGTEGVSSPVLMLNMNDGSLTACFCLDEVGASLAAQAGTEAFRSAAEKVGILIQTFTQVHAYVAPELEERDEEDDESEGGF